METNREDVLREIKKYFDIEELVCDHMLERWKDDPERCWDFLDTNFLAVLLILRRDIIQRPMYCNNHKRGQHQRGIRCNMCEMVKEKTQPYLSAHVLGKGADFSIEGIAGVRAMDYQRKKIHLAIGYYPVPIRMEAGVSWLHIDVMPTPNGQKIYEFTA